MLTIAVILFSLINNNSVDACLQTSDTMIYALTNQIIIDQKIQVLSIKTGYDQYFDSDNKLRFDPLDAEFWLKKDKINKDQITILRNIDKQYLTEQAYSRTLSKWDRKKITVSVKFSKNGFYSNIRHWFSKNAAYVLDKPRYSISVPLFNESKELAYIFITSFSGPVSGYGSILIYTRTGNKWTVISEIPVYIS